MEQPVCIGKREKPKSEILTIEQFERRIKDGWITIRQGRYCIIIYHYQ